MKLFRLSMIGVICLAGSLSLRGEEDLRSKEVARRAKEKVQQERLQKLGSLVDDLLAAQMAQQEKIDQMADEIQDLKKELESAQKNLDNRVQTLVSRTEFEEFETTLNKTLAKQSNSLRETVLKQLKSLEKKLSLAPVPSVPEPVIEPIQDNVSKEGFVHEVEKGQILSWILDAYNEQFESEGLRRVGLQEVLGHPDNRQIKADLIRPGDKVFIPKPDKK